MALMLWAFLNRFYVLMLQHMELKEKVGLLQGAEETDGVGGGVGDQGKQAFWVTCNMTWRMVLACGGLRVFDCW